MLCNSICVSPLCCNEAKPYIIIRLGYKRRRKYIEPEYTNIHIEDINKDIFITVTEVGTKAGSHSGSKKKKVPPFIPPNIPCPQETAAGRCPEPNGLTSKPHTHFCVHFRYNPKSLKEFSFLSFPSKFCTHLLFHTCYILHFSPSP
jgi:hypothetical protein